MTREDIQAVMAKYPGLNALGLFPVPMNFTYQLAYRMFKMEQHNLLNSVAQCTACERWLDGKGRIKAVGYWRGKYSSDLRRRVERERKVMLSEGAMIAAALHCGFPVRQSAASGVGMAWIGISNYKPANPSVRDESWEPFIAAILADVEAESSRLIFADQLEEWGCSVQAAALRTLRFHALHGQFAFKDERGRRRQRTAPARPYSFAAVEPEQKRKWTWFLREALPVL